MVVFSRPLVATGDMQPTIDGSGPVDVAFAVWDGSLGERNGMKSVSAFTQLRVTPEDPPRRAVPETDQWPAYTPSNPMLLVSSVFIGLLLVASVVLWRHMRRDEEGSPDAPIT
jgi:hypothetical protein